MKKYSYKKMLETGEIPPEVQDAMDRVNRLFKAWYQKQDKDFEDNKAAVKEYMLSQGRIIPPNFKRFWKWYLNYCGENDFELTREIEPPDFALYDKWERDQLVLSSRLKKKKEYTDKAGAVAIYLAFDNGNISEDLYYSKAALIQLARNVFSMYIKNGEKLYREVYNIRIDGIDDIKTKDSINYKLGEELYSKHFK